MRAFRVKDLMINVVPEHMAWGSAGMPGPDDDITDFPPTITPVIAVAVQTPVFQALANVEFEKLNYEVVDRAIIDVGKAVIGSVSQCSVDMPTCEANPIISPVAAGAATNLRFEDLETAKILLTETLEHINRVEEERLELALKNGKEIVPMIEDALAELKERL